MSSKNLPLFFYGTITLPVTAISGLFLCVVQTLGGLLFALCIWCLWLGPAIWLFYQSREQKKRGKMGILASLGLAGILYLCCVGLAPALPKPTSAGASAHFAKPSMYTRWSIANVVPEIDQFTFGSYLIPFVDPYLGLEKSKALRKAFLGVYRELREDPDFLSLGSVMNDAYGEVFGYPSQVKHIYTYYPKTKREHHPKKLPVILFLHGSLGNFKGYLWVWKAFAQKYGYAIVAPSFGAGFWNHPNGLKRVKEALAFIRRQPGYDAQRVVLAGLSNGGRGVTRAGAAFPKAFRALVFLSAVIEYFQVDNSQFITSWKHRPVFILHGDKDLRIPIEDITLITNLMRKNQVKVSTYRMKEEDHFLFFAKRNEAITLLGKWLQGQKL